MEELKSKRDAWVENNHDKLLKSHKKNRNTPERKQYLKEFRQRNRANKLCTDQKHNWDNKVRVLSLVADNKPIQCVRCGIRDKRILQIHHINGNGQRDRKFYYKTNITVRLNNSKEKVNIEELEIRCCNCNILAEYDDLKRRYTNIIGFDDEFNPIWRVMPRKVKPIEPLVCDQCGEIYKPNYRKERKFHFCSRECYQIFMVKNGYPNRKNKEDGRFEGNAKRGCDS